MLAQLVTDEAELGSKEKWCVIRVLCLFLFLW
jgi:hypothetical protein